MTREQKQEDTILGRGMYGKPSGIISENIWSAVTSRTAIQARVPAHVVTRVRRTLSRIINPELVYSERETSPHTEEIEFST